ncbi:MAG: glycosyltransferase [Oribacterium sp.]|nr:glycosyltransferase [Oribacterium sp.]MBQ5330779.1 glycosyltransferase [Oscillospiraceae bacterium]
MRILIVIGGFFPGKKCGGPPVSVDNFCSLMKDYECYIITVNHDLFETKPYENIQEGWNDRGNSKVLYLSDSEYNKRTFEKYILEIYPDILYLQGVFQACILPCLQLAKKHDIKVLLAPRGELCEGAFNLKRYKKVPYVELIKRLGLVSNIHWQSTSDEETEAIKRLMKASNDLIHRLDNIPSIPKKDYPRREKVAGEGKFVFLSRIHPKKNLLFAISLFKEIQGNVEFDIYGPIEDEDYWRRCQEEIKQLPKNVKVEYKGLVGHDQVHEVFSQYDAFLFPTLSENYGHVIAESLIVGTPVIISNQTPWRGLEGAEAGWDINLKNANEFKNSLNLIIELSEKQMLNRRKNARNYINNALDIQKIHHLYSQALQSVCFDKQNNTVS